MSDGTPETPVLSAVEVMKMTHIAVIQQTTALTEGDGLFFV